MSMTENMNLTHLCFCGPRKEAAQIKFGMGLNLVYGASNTGKSSILDAIDFMLGRSRVLKEIPEHEGYDQVLLGVNFSEGGEFTLVRSIQGGDYKCYQGNHLTEPDSEYELLKVKAPTKKYQTITQFILGKVNLADKKMKRDAKNRTYRLTLRNLLPLSLITETKIQKEGSPYISEQYSEKTLESSRLRLMLTGVDDSAIVPEETEKRVVSRQARIEILDELIEEQENQLESEDSEAPLFSDLTEQNERLDESLRRSTLTLNDTQNSYNELLQVRNEYREVFNKNTDRISEIKEMLVRFYLLNEQYLSDVERLNGIDEAGSLIAALPSKSCPLCGATENHQNPDEICDGNVAEVLTAAKSEIRKISTLQSELTQLIEQLENESADLSDAAPSIKKDLSTIEKQISDLNPSLNEQRSEYSNLLNKKADVEKLIYILKQLERLNRRKEIIELEAPIKSGSSEETINLPTKALYDLSQVVASILKKWGLSNVGQVHFANDMNDFVIGGKHRTSNGKGHRALTHASATLALMRHLEERDLPHIGFVVLDSPLLAYEEPENDEDDLSETDINKRFFEYLSRWKSRQSIIFENKKSIPEEFSSGSQILHFTKNKRKGRFGFFPTSS